MSLQHIVKKYLGWCPRLDVFSTRSTLLPITNLSRVEKVVIAAILASWGLFSTLIYLGTPGTLDTLQYAAHYPPAAVSVVLTVLSVASGIMLLALLADYTVTRRVVKRHKYELISILFAQALYSLFTPLNVVSPYLAGVPMDQVKILLANNLASSIPQALLFGYLAYRIVSNRGILSRNTFLMLSIAFAAPIAVTVGTSYLSTGSRDLLGWMNTGLFLLAYSTGAIFCLSVYLRTSGETTHDLSLPLYARAAIFIYGIAHSGIFSYLFTGEAKYLLFISGNTGILAYAPYFVFFLGLMIASLFPLKLRIGEETLEINQQ
jgi:hypothetical protein